MLTAQAIMVWMLVIQPTFRQPPVISGPYASREDCLRVLAAVTPLTKDGYPLITMNAGCVQITKE